MKNSKKINTAIVIDDNDIDQMLYKRIIKRSKRIDNVIGYTDARKALEFLKSDNREKVDVIFLDINMPRMDGFEFLEAVTDQFGDAFSSAVVVMITTSLAKEDEERASKFDIVKTYLHKPITVEDIETIAEDIGVVAGEDSLAGQQKNRRAF